MSDAQPTKPRRRPPRERGVYVPIDDVSMHLANGWRVLDDLAGADEVLLAPPAPWKAAA